MVSTFFTWAISQRSWLEAHYPIPRVSPLSVVWSARQTTGVRHRFVSSRKEWSDGLSTKCKGFDLSKGGKEMLRYLFQDTRDLFDMPVQNSYLQWPENTSGRFSYDIT
jgi:hypothetical protein